MTHKSKIIVTLLSLACFTGFFFVNWKVNYPIHREIRANIVNHPEFVPQAKTARISSSGFDNIVADAYWLSAIQYIGSNAIGSEYKKYLYVMIDLITDLNPYFTYPYRIGLLLIPDVNERYEKISKTEVEKNNNESVRLGLKGIEKTCDKNKVEIISQEYNLRKLWTEEKYKNPCRDAYIPYYLAYVYYWNLHDGANASKYYRVASANDDAPKGSRSMAAIMQGKSGDREKAIIMFLSLAESIEGKKNEACIDFSKQLGGLLLEGFTQKAKLNGKFLAQVEAYRSDIAKKLGEEKEIDSANIDDLCSNYLNKAVREINLTYLEDADKRYFADKKEHATDTKVLFDAKYIDYFPRDYQKQGKSYEVIYYYNPDTGHWDSKMGEY